MTADSGSVQVRRPTYKPKKNKVNWMGDFAPMMDSRWAALDLLHTAALQSCQGMRNRGPPMQPVSRCTMCRPRIVLSAACASPGCLPPLLIRQLP